MARASTSAFITMPGPPPAGVSSTVRCLSVAALRMSIVSSDHRPPDQAPCRRGSNPSGPGNISGNIVRTLARHIVRSQSLLLVDGSSSAITLSGGSTTIRPCERSIAGTAASVNGSMHRRTVAKADFENVAGAEIRDGDEPSELFALRRDRRRGRSDRRDKIRRRRCPAAGRAERRASRCAALPPRCGRRCPRSFATK